MILYKYRSVSGQAFRYTQDIFINRRLFLPSASKLNDPNEGISNLNIQNQYWAWGNQLEERNRQQSVKLCAFTEMHKNPVVWSHYADEHRGICIELDSNNIDLSSGLLGRVNYSNVVPILEHNSGADKRVAFLNKTDEWAYEKEWRFIADNSNPYLPFNDSAIKRVFLGARFAKEDLSWVTFWISNYSPSKKIPIIKMKFATADYMLYEEGEMGDKIARIGQ